MRLKRKFGVFVYHAFKRMLGVFVYRAFKRTIEMFLYRLCGKPKGLKECNEMLGDLLSYSVLIIINQP